ncbi:hypothetical protein H5410_002121 [Solanum commersonii]|uniref:Uncharacterized protein n=1 Tax=Solanum commersonii TaxID=4109 RepID=A0A9J6B164_SOLCO|nr:hypothetical protein H5410_002121 [Solanum commersonii]
MKLGDHQRDYAEEKSNGFKALEDLHKGAEAGNKVVGGKVLEETKSATLVEHLKFNLNVPPEPKEEESY